MYPLPMCVTPEVVREMCKDILGEEDFKELPPVVYDFVVENNGKFTSEEIIRKLRECWFKKPLQVHEILYYLAYAGKLRKVKCEDDIFRWEIIKWNDSITDDVAFQAAQQDFEDYNAYRVACYAVDMWKLVKFAV